MLRIILSNGNILIIGRLEDILDHITSIKGAIESIVYGQILYKLL